MAKRYSIMVTEYGSDREVELCQVEQNPDATVEGAKAKSLMIFNGKIEPALAHAEIHEHPDSR